MDGASSRSGSGRNGRVVASSLTVTGIVALVLAYGTISGLLGPYAGNVTVVDLVVLLALGLIAGAALALAAVAWRGGSRAP